MFEKEEKIKVVRLPEYSAPLRKRDIFMGYAFMLFCFCGLVSGGAI